MADVKIMELPESGKVDVLGNEADLGLVGPPKPETLTNTTITPKTPPEPISGEIKPTEP